MTTSLTLALDIGSSSLRAALYDHRARPLPRTAVKLEGVMRNSEIDADEAFDDVSTSIDSCLAKAEKVPGEIDFIASCSFWHSLMGVDGKGRPSTPVLTWADTQSRNYTTDLKKRLDERAVHNRTGAHFHSSYWPAKLLWLRRERPDVWSRTAKWLSFGDYVSLRLFGSASTSISMASGTGLFDIRKQTWDVELLKLLRVRKAQLPELAIANTSVRPKPAFARRWPRLAHARWFPTIADGAADSIGSGCITENKAALMIGTSGAMRVIYAGEPPDEIPPGLWCYRVDDRRVIIGGALSDGGNLYAWLRRNLRVPKNDADEMRRRGAAAHGLTFLPFFHGERSTRYNENAKAAIFGLTASHDSIDILQAGMESVAYRFAEIFDRLKKVTRIKGIVASGGALRDSPVWAQIIADVLGRDLTLNDTRESALRGAVLLALESTGKIESIESIPPKRRGILKYHPECHAVYKKARKT